MTARAYVPPPPPADSQDDPYGPNAFALDGGHSFTQKGEPRELPRRSVTVADITPRVTRDKTALWSRSDEQDTADKRRDVESRAGVGDVLALTQRRHDLVREAAPLRALRDTFDARRKAERGKVLAVLNKERSDRQEKEVAATLAETVASGDPRYTDFLDAAALAFAHLAIIEDEIQAITDILHRDQALLRYAANEPRG